MKIKKIAPILMLSLVVVGCGKKDATEDAVVNTEPAETVDIDDRDDLVEDDLEDTDIVEIEDDYSDLDDDIDDDLDDGDDN